jgi:adenylate kinase
VVGADRPGQKPARLRIVFLGPPGAGKGTQAARLSEGLRVPRISTGDMLRDAIARGTELGQEAAPLIEKGQLVPDKLLIGMIGERLKQPDCERGYILDGFPRTVAQAEAFDLMTEGASDQPGDFVVFRFDVPYFELLKRLSGRRWCPSCQATYHIDNNPPQRDSLCDREGTQVIQREDDKEEAVHRRLKDYEALTAPLVEYYRKRSRLYDVDGFRPPDAVFAELTGILGMAKEATR